MPILLIIFLLVCCICLTALNIVDDRFFGVVVFGFWVLVLGNKLCKATNWMDKEKQDG